MQRLPIPCWILSLTLAAIPVFAQDTIKNLSPTPAPPAGATQARAGEATSPIPKNAPRMSKQTRYQIIRDFETQLVYSRTTFPLGTKGLVLKDGQVSPAGQILQSMLAIDGPSIKPGDPAHISYVKIHDNCIHFDLNGGAIRRKKWYQRVEVSGASGEPIPLSNNESINNPHGSYLDVYFDSKYVPEMTAAQLRNLLYPVLDFNAHSKEQAYLDTVPPKVKEAILAHHVLVGMNSEMVIHAMGKPPHKDRERDGETEYEEWIYGTPPQDVNFVRFVGDEVVRVETMKVGGEKIVRTAKEVDLPKPDQNEQAKQEQDRPANAPSLRRPGEDQENVPKSTDGSNPNVPIVPPDVPQVPDTPGGPGSVVTR